MYIRILGGGLPWRRKPLKVTDFLEKQAFFAPFLPFFAEKGQICQITWMPSRFSNVWKKLRKFFQCLENHPPKVSNVWKKR